MDQDPSTVLPAGEEELRTETNHDKLYSCWMCAVLVPTGVVHCGLPCGHAVHEDCLRQFALATTNTGATLSCKCQRQFQIPAAIIQERDYPELVEWFGNNSAPPTTSTAEAVEVEREATRLRTLERGFAKTRPRSPPPCSNHIPSYIWKSMKPVHGRSEWEVHGRSEWCGVYGQAISAQLVRSALGCVARLGRQHSDRWSDESGDQP